MNPEEYAWNVHERKCYENDQVILPSPYKLRILDDGEKRLELELVLEQLPQGQLARWAMKMASSFIPLIDTEDEFEKQKILTQVRAVFQARLDGRASAYELRKAGFLANKLLSLIHILREIFPKGSVMTVYYNPEKPEKAFVERYTGFDRIFRLLIIIFSIIGFVLIAVILGISLLK